MPAKKARVTPAKKAKKAAKKVVRKSRGQIILDGRKARAAAKAKKATRATKAKAKKIAVPETEVEKVFVVCTADPKHTDANSHVEKNAFAANGAVCGCGAPLRERTGTVKTPDAEIPF